MPAYVATFSSYYTTGGIGSSDLGFNWDNGTITDSGDESWTLGEALTDTSGSGIFFSNGATYQGTIEVNGTDYPVVEVTLTGAWVVLFDDATDHAAAPATMPAPDTSAFTACFMDGTGIATADGEVAVEDLKIGDMILDQNGAEIAVKWIGTKNVLASFQPAERLMPVRFAAGSLGEGVPYRDLTVTADHAMLVDGVLCQASALVNGSSIYRVPLDEMGQRFKVYHVETEAHEIILANGAPAETFIDNVSRRMFANFAEYEALYGEEAEMEELPLPRAMSARQLPSAIRARLGHSKAA